MRLYKVWKRTCGMSSTGGSQRASRTLDIDDHDDSILDYRWRSRGATHGEPDQHGAVVEISVPLRLKADLSRSCNETIE